MVVNWRGKKEEAHSEKEDASAARCRQLAGESILESDLCGAMVKE